MKKTLKFLFVSFAIGWATNAMAEIDPGATSASHKLEKSAEKIHDYLHHHYSSGYGSHELEESATAMHDALHEWQDGAFKETDISELKTELKASWNNFRQTLIPAGLLASGDDLLEDHYQNVKMSYKNLRFLLRKSDR